MRKQIKNPKGLVQFSWEKSTVEEVLADNKEMWDKYAHRKLKMIDGE